MAKDCTYSMKMQGEMATDPYVEKSKSFSQPLSSYSNWISFKFRLYANKRGLVVRPPYSTL